MAEQDTTPVKDWPEVEFTDLYPKFYLDKLESGEDWEKKYVSEKFLNQYSNNFLMDSLKQYENGVALQIMAKYEQECKEKDVPCVLANVLCGLGHPDYKMEGYYMNCQWNTRGNGDLTNSKNLTPADL